MERDPVNGWRHFYYILIAIYCISTLGFIVGYNPPPLPSQRARTARELIHDLDVVGIGLFSAGFALILLALNWGGYSYACESLKLHISTAGPKLTSSPQGIHRTSSQA